MFTVFMLEPATFRFRCAFALAMTVVTLMALLPAPELPVTLWDKANHALAYFFLAYLGDRGFPSTVSKKPFISVLLGLFAYGVVIEGLQSQIPSRYASLLDMVANGFGLMLYALARTLTVKAHG
jgi:VanZ family protein